jgi:hypothetical protein
MRYGGTESAGHAPSPELDIEGFDDFGEWRNDDGDDINDTGTGVESGAAAPQESIDRDGGVGGNAESPLPDPSLDAEQATASGRAGGPRPRRLRQPSRLRQCVTCKRVRYIKGYGRCEPCYKKQRYRPGSLDPACNPPVRTCVDCNENKPIYARDRCHKCYKRRNNERRNAAGKCSWCGNTLDGVSLRRCNQCLERKAERRRERGAANAEGGSQGAEIGHGEAVGSTGIV